MFAATSERRLDATPVRVFAALIDAGRYHEWLVGARAVVVDDDRWPRAGSPFDHEVGLCPVDVQDSTTVVGMEPWRRLDLIVRTRPFLVADVCFEVTPLGSGSCIRMTETPRGALVVLGPLIAPLVRWRNRRSLAKLAEQMASCVPRRAVGRGRSTVPPVSPVSPVSPVTGNSTCTTPS